MKYRMKPDGPDITIVDGPLAGRTYRAGASYDEIPAGYEDRFEPADEPEGPPMREMGED